MPVLQIATTIPYPVGPPTIPPSFSPTSLTPVLTDRLFVFLHARHSFYAVRPPLAEGAAPTSWAIFPSRPAADAYAATLEPVEVIEPSVPSQGMAPDDNNSTATIRGFGDAMSAMVYASRGTAGVQSLVGGGKRRKKKRKKRDRDGGGGRSTAVYAAGTCDMLASRLDGRQDPYLCRMNVSVCWVQ